MHLFGKPDLTSKPNDRNSTNNRSQKKFGFKNQSPQYINKTQSFDTYFQRSSSNSAKNKSNLLRSSTESKQNKQNLIDPNKQKLYQRKVLDPIDYYKSVKTGPQKKYNVDTKNIFYQQRTQVKYAKFARTLFYLIIIAMICIAIFQIMVSSVEKFDTNAKLPPNSYITPNGALKCLTGYQKINNKCQIKQQIVSKAQQTFHNLISQIRYQYGQQDCTSGEKKQIPTLKISKQIFSDQSQEQQRVLFKQLQRLLSKENSLNNYYSYDSYQRIITPKTKLYGWICNFKLTSQSKQFKISFTLLMIIIIIIFYQKKKYNKNKIAKQIYLHLKQKLKSDEVCIKQQTQAIQKKFGKMTPEIWDQVDQIRKQQGLIVVCQQTKRGQFWLFI